MPRTGRTYILVSGRWDGTLSVVDLDAALNGKDAVTSRPLVTRGCGLPVSIAVAADRGHVFVVNHAGNATAEATARMPHGHAGTVAVLDTAKAIDPAHDGTLGALTEVLDVEGCGPVGCALTPDARHLLVTSAEGDGTEDGGHLINIFDTTTGERRSHALSHSGRPCFRPSPNLGFGGHPNPNGIAITPAHGGLVFTGNGGTDDVSVLRLPALLAGNRNAETGRIPLPSGPFGIAVSPDGSLLAVANRENARTGVEGNTVSIIDTAKAATAPEGAVMCHILVGTDDPSTLTRPTAVAFSRNSLFVSCTRTGTISRIDVRAALSGAPCEQRVQLEHSAGEPPCPRGVVATPDGRFLVAAGGRKSGARSGTLWVLESRTLKPLARVHSVGNEPYLLECVTL